ncbi:TPA: Spo0E family sporulation regulatory protein-aspartic acid phosphatase, partial [Bacillus cereus]|nr:Spo0E family sporulation regulatory protein-aspartic acid phosphatase [Bacillus cereus]
ALSQELDKLINYFMFLK